MLASSSAGEAAAALEEEDEDDDDDDADVLVSLLDEEDEAPDAPAALAESFGAVSHAARRPMAAIRTNKRFVMVYTPLEQPVKPTFINLEIITLILP